MIDSSLLISTRRVLRSFSHFALIGSESIKMIARQRFGEERIFVGVPLRLNNRSWVATKSNGPAEGGNASPSPFSIVQQSLRSRNPKQHTRCSNSGLLR